MTTPRLTPERKALIEAMLDALEFDGEVAWSEALGRLNASEEAKEYGDGFSAELVLSDALCDMRAKLRDTTARAEQADRLEKDCKALREMLAFAASGFTHLYTDDGELHDASERPHIDYRRDTVEQIQEAIRQRNQQRLSSPSPDGASALQQAEKEKRQLQTDRDALAKLANAWNECDRCRLADEESDEPADNTARHLEAAEAALREAWRAASGALQRAKGVQP